MQMQNFNDFIDVQGVKMAIKHDKKEPKKEEDTHGVSMNFTQDRIDPSVDEDLSPVGIDDDISDVDLEEAKSKSKLSLGNLDHSNLFADFDPDEEEDIEAEIRDSRVTQLDDDPMLGGGVRGRPGSDLFGNRAASPSGRSISPKLYAQAAKFPSCSQLRVWKWENGIPVGLGAIDAMSSEEDLVREFFAAMPKKGEGRCQFKLRPIDINGAEMGQEVTVLISEHHAAIQRIRRMKEDEDSQDYRRGHLEEEHQPHDQFAPQWDRMMGMGEKRAELLERQLEDEREALRRREEQRMQEQVDLATSAAQGVQVLTERMMADESKRAERAMAMQTEQSQTLITTLTSIFAQQQTMLQSQMETQRRQDEYRLEQERQRFERERAEGDARRDRERLELEERRRRERDEYERKMQAERENLERKLLREQKDMEMRMQREREEQHFKVTREKEERQSRERWFAEERLRKEAQEREDARQRELDRQRQHERMMRELEVQQQKDREHAERMMILSKQELQNKAMGGLGEMLPMATGMLKKMGLDPKDVVQKIFAPEEQQQSAWADTLPKILGAGADIARVALSGGAAVSPIGSQPQLVPQISQDEFAEIDYRQQMERMRQPVPEMPYSDEVIGGEEDQVISYHNTTLSTPPPTEPKPTAPSSNMDIASKAGMTLGEQRDARNGLTLLVQTLHGSDQGTWEGHITSGIMAEPQIFTYIQAVSVRSAIREAGADATLTENIVKALQSSALVPGDVNYGV